MKNLVYYFGCGRYVSRNNKNTGNFIVTKFNDMNLKIIYFFKKYPIRGVKALHFSDFCEGAELMKKGANLTLKGLEDFNDFKRVVFLIKK